jgi:rRNA-processing protein FCF1
MCKLPRHAELGFGWTNKAHTLQQSDVKLGLYLLQIPKKMQCKSNVLQDPRLEVLPCMHSGTYADDCICERIRQHKCYIVATCDRDLRRRIRKAGLAWWQAA